MAPLPKRRWSRSRQAKKRATHIQKSPAMSLCPNCHQPKFPHGACPSCGFYKGRKIIEIKKTEKRQK